MTVLQDTSLAIDIGIQSEVGAGNTSLTKDEFKNILRYWRDYEALLCDEFHRDNPGEVFTLDPEIKGLRERLKYVSDVLEDQKDGEWVFYKYPKGWVIGPKSDPLYIETQADSSFQ